MKLIIDIPEDVYTRLFDNGIQDNEIETDDICEMARALRLGIPLPENHGRVRYIKCEVLDKIRAEIEAIIGEHNLDDYDFCSGLICARKIIDKYKAESEETDADNQT